ncbi:MAG: hypothetical protein KIT14_10720 [bacterium]|nr:hypothetical protein [bacterium]
MYGRSLLSRAALALVLLLAAPPPAPAIVFYSSQIGWRFASTPGRVDEGFDFKLNRLEPTTVGVRGLLLSRRGALCPAPGTPDFLCAEAFSKAGSVGGRLTLHSSTRLVRAAATGLGAAVDAVYADTTVEIVQLGAVGVTPPIAIAYIVFGLHGTASTSASDPSVTALAFSSARLDGAGVQCVGTICEPVRRQNWTPQSLRLNLRTDVIVAAPDGLPFAAEVVADFADTFELLAIALHDENDEPIPGAAVVVTDGDGATLFTIPSTVETTTSTTLPGDTTTTTSTTTPGGDPTTTTTTPPSGCPTGATFGSIACRLDALEALLPSGAGNLGAKLLARVTAARTALATAQAGGAPGRIGKALKKVRKALAAFGRTLRTRKAQRLVPEPARTQLRDAGAALIADVRALARLDVADKQGEGAAPHEHRTSRWDGGPGPRARDALGRGR